MPVGDESWIIIPLSDATSKSENELLVILPAVL